MIRKRIERLYREEKEKMISYIRSHTDDRARDPEDLVQDVMLKMFSILTLNTKIENLAAYAWKSLKNLIIDNRRRPAIWNNDIDMDDQRDLSDINTPEDNMLREHFSEHLNHALMQLNPSERAVWIATEIDGDTFRELAETWEEPLGTLLSRKYRAEKKILNYLNTIYKEN
jgi:RNA polymerase sigma factor (sigma-70 family)